MNIRKIFSVFSFQLSAFCYYYRWHPEVALRYLPITKELKNRNLKRKTTTQKLKVLEVGSGSLGIAPYLKMPVTGVDVDFSGPKFPLLKQIKGQADTLPFKDNDFEVVLCVDLLEHLPGKNRGAVIKEMLRVAKEEVIIAVPCGKKSLEQDKDLAKEYQRIFKKPFPYFKEHLDYGLPEKEEILKFIKEKTIEVDKKIEIEIKGNENLKIRHFLMRGWLTKNFLADFIFRKVFLFFIPLFQALDKPPYYRQIFFVTIKNVKKN